MKLSEYAKKNSISYRTAWEHWSRGIIVGAYALPSGTVVVPDASTKGEYIAVYSLSEENQKILQMFCYGKGWQIQESVQEIVGTDKALVKLLRDGRVTKIVVEHKTQLPVAHMEYIEIVCKHIGCELIFLNEGERK